MTDLHPDEAALLAAVVAAPDDDVPRGVFADWLDENGRGDRAAFVRLQCDLAAGDRHERPESGAREMNGAGHRVGCPGCVLRREETDFLIGRVGSGGEGPAASWIGVDGLTVHLPNMDAGWPRAQSPGVLFRRGFVESATLPWADWLAHADALLARHPVRQVTLTTLPAWPEEGRDGWERWYRLDAGGRSICRTVAEPDVADFRGDSQRVMIEAALAGLWPGIKFALPPVAWQDADRTITVGEGDPVRVRPAR